MLGLVPWLFLPPKWPLLIASGAAVFFSCCWVAASWKTRPRAMVGLVKHQPEKRKPSRALRWVLGFALALSSGAALCQAIGPDGETAEWTAEVLKAGGGPRAVSIDRVVSEPQTTGVNINDEDEYAATVVVTLDYPGGRRAVTVKGARTAGEPKPGDTTHVMYAPRSPELGVRDNPAGFFDTGFYLIFIWAWTLVVAFGTVGYLDIDDVAWLRRFRPIIHVPAFAILICGAALLLPTALGYPSTLHGWLLAVAAAATPWLAVTWIVRARWHAA
ncbi:hypothetical protein [Streptomyces sp. NPDC000229]|uniref:hypothetical protein n=1 Tax=Streptomyces sp. NPDC000229 TaxID=3154247 RepID=UPI0033235AC4